MSDRDQEKMQFCFNCGCELGRYRAYYGDIQSCGEPECSRAEREAHQAEREEAHQQLDDERGWGNW
jgi:hypothetical protein